MTLSALLLAGAEVAGQQTATVAPAVKAPITVGVTDTNCREVTFTIGTSVPVSFSGDIGDQPPMHTSGTVTHFADPGTTVRWGVLCADTLKPGAEGTHVVPPCLAPALEPRPQIVTNDTVEIGTPVRIERRRSDLWNWTLRRFGGAW